MSKCIICGRYVDKTYGNSNLMGIYCRSCATENHYTNEQLIEDLQSQIAELKAENERLSNILKANETVKNEKSAKLEKAEHDVKRYRLEIQKSQQQIHDLPKQVCDKIRDVAGDYYECIDTNIVLTINDVDEILDQIEKGEL